MNQTETLDLLASKVLLLPEFRRTTALDLVSKGRRWTLSEKQMNFVRVLIEIASGNAPKPQRVDVGDMSGVIGLFDKAKKHLKFPAIVLAYQDGEQVSLLTLKVASENASVPGSVNVVTEGKDWLGRVLVDGQFDMNRKLPDMARAAVPALIKFAADPVTGAKESARLTGKCCFCHTKLKDERSTNVGYGKICASRYGLPWGAK